MNERIDLHTLPSRCPIVDGVVVEPSGRVVPQIGRGVDVRGGCRCCEGVCE